MSFTEAELERLTVEVSGKTIAKVTEDNNAYGGDYLVFEFTDGTELRLRYDWIYSGEVSLQQREKVASEEG